MRASGPDPVQQPSLIDFRSQEIRSAAWPGSFTGLVTSPASYYHAWVYSSFSLVKAASGHAQWGALWGMSENKKLSIIV